MWCRCLLVALWAVVWGCSSSTNSGALTATDAQADAATDASGDAAADVSADASADASGDGVVACYPLFHACTATEQCCAPNRCLIITSTPACQQEGPRGDGGP